MGLRIRTNTDSLTAQRNLRSNQTDLQESMQKLSSGQRINKSADDAAGLAISESLRAQTRGLNQAKRNANDGISLVQVAEGGLNEISNIMVRMRELTVQASSDTIGAKERGFLDKEYQELKGEIDRISETTEFNGRQLLDASGATGVFVQVGYNSGASNALELKLKDDSVDIDKIDTTNLNLQDTSIGLENREEVVAHLDTIDDALNTVASARATLGATQSRLTSAINNIGTSIENMSAANSRIRDVDYAEETAKLTQARIMSNASVSIISQANQKPELALALLR